jgi:hypothetical protein
MSSTKKIISDAVLYKLAGGVPMAGFPIQERDIWSSLEDIVNAKFKLNQFNTNLPSGETIPDNLAIATYEDVTVTSVYSGKSKSTLPVMPISLPRNAGINEIRPVLSQVTSGDKILGSPIIPLISGQDFLLSADTLLNDLMGQFAYTPNGKTVYYNKDLTTFGVTKVDMKLIVFDISQYSTTEEIPVPADYIGELTDILVNEFAPVLAKTGWINDFTNSGQQTPQTAVQQNNKR